MISRLSPLAIVAFALTACDSGSSRRSADAAESSEAVTPTTGTRVETIELGRSAAQGSLRVTQEETSFGPRDTMFLSVVVNNPVEDARLSARWTYQDGSVIDSSGQEIDREEGSSSSVTQFRVSSDRQWRPGNYSVDVWLNGTLVGTKTFTVGQQQGQQGTQRQGTQRRPDEQQPVRRP